MKNWKTTTVAILTALGTIIAVATSWLSTGQLDAQTGVSGVMGLLVALGFWKAADA